MQSDVAAAQHNLAQDVTQYKWYSEQYVRLKTEYNEAFQLMAPPQQQQQAERRRR